MDMELLTTTERRIAQLIAAGWQDKAIAQAIGVSPDSTRQRVHVISQKIGAQNRVMIATWYVRQTEVRQ